MKPGNFVVGLKEKRNLYIIDFGLARKYIDGVTFLILCIIIFKHSTCFRAENIDLPVEKSDGEGLLVMDLYKLISKRI